MGHWCKICSKIKPNEKFSGKGHKNHICKNCAKKSKEELDAIIQEQEILGYLEQSNISKKNIVRLETFVGSKNIEIAKLAKIVLEIVKVQPHKKNRFKFLAKNYKELFLEFKKVGLYLY